MGQGREGSFKVKTHSMGFSGSTGNAIVATQIKVIGLGNS